MCLTEMPPSVASCLSSPLSSSIFAFLKIGFRAVHTSFTPWPPSETVPILLSIRSLQMDKIHPDQRHVHEERILLEKYPLLRNIGIKQRTPSSLGLIRPPCRDPLVYSSQNRTVSVLCPSWIIFPLLWPFSLPKLRNIRSGHRLFSAVISERLILNAGSSDARNVVKLRNPSCLSDSLGTVFPPSTQREFEKMDNLGRLVAQPAGDVSTVSAVAVSPIVVAMVGPC